MTANGKRRRFLKFFSFTSWGDQRRRKGNGKEKNKMRPTQKSPAKGEGVGRGGGGGGKWQKKEPNTPHTCFLRS